MKKTALIVSLTWWNGESYEDSYEYVETFLLGAFTDAELPDARKRAIKEIKKHCIKKKKKNRGHYALKVDSDYGLYRLWKYLIAEVPLDGFTPIKDDTDISHFGEMKRNDLF